MATWITLTTAEGRPQPVQVARLGTYRKLDTSEVEMCHADPRCDFSGYGSEVWIDGIRFEVRETVAEIRALLGERE